ncbi:MAG: PH domain-containing protein [Pseudomonadota bacterium]
MSYLRKAIGPNETLKYKAKVHWVVFLNPIILMLVGLLLVAATGGFSVILLILGFLGLIGGFIYSATTDLAVTNKKVIAKWGLISRKTIEQRLSKIDTVQVDQSVFGRILNYGSITVTGSGFTPTPIKNIADPMTFRRSVEQAEEQAEQV